MIKEILLIGLKAILIAIGFSLALFFIVSFPYIIDNKYGKIIIGILLIPIIYVTKKKYKCL
jgi:hypothetical protein